MYYCHIASDLFLLNLPVHANVSHSSYCSSGWNQGRLLLSLVVMYILLGLMGRSAEEDTA